MVVRVPAGGFVRSAANSRAGAAARPCERKPAKSLLGAGQA
jgi:hypothetical protein